MTDGQDGSAGFSPSAPSADALRQAKRALRGEMKQRRAALSPDWRRQAAEALADRFMASIPLDGSSTVAAFLPIGDEVDILVLLRRLARAGHACCLPVIDGPDRPLAFHGWMPDDPLVAGPHGIAQPDARMPSRPDLLIVPLLAFDRAGRRLGYGKGYYDRTLADLRGQGHVTAVGAAYSVQEAAEVPVDEFDAVLDGVVTEREAIFPIRR